MCATFALAQDEATNPTYVMQGVVYGLPGADQGAAFKGQVVLQDDVVEQAMFEAAGVEVEINSADGQLYSMLVFANGSTTSYGLRDVGVTISDTMTLQGLVIDSITDQEMLFLASDFELTDEVFEGSVAGGEPDVTASRVGLTSGGNGSDDFEYYGTANSIRAFAMASTSCNVGNATAEWISGSSARHPVIGQNVFRLKDGRFEQIGQSFLKHSFCAVSEFTCGACQSTNCNTLGIGCADTYWADLNDGQGGGRKSQINPLGLQINGSGPGTHSHPIQGATTDPIQIRGRLQIHSSDIVSGAQYFAEIQYITHDEQISKRHNNASWREINLSQTSMSGVGSGQDSVVFMQPGIRAWKSNDGFVQERFVDDPEGGRFFLAFKVSDNGDGTWHYEYAIQNLNSDMSAVSFSVPVGAGVNVTNVGFHDVDYHSGEVYDETDWSVTVGNGDIRWETTPHAQNQNANALRWGTLYNFRFDADSAPEDVTAQLGWFKDSGSGDISVEGPMGGGAEPCPWDVDGDGMVGVTDLVQIITDWGPCPGCASDVTGDGIVGTEDLVELILNWGDCP